MIPFPDMVAEARACGYRLAGHVEQAHRSRSDGDVRPSGFDQHGMDTSAGEVAVCSLVVALFRGREA